MTARAERRFRAITGIASGATVTLPSAPTKAGNTFGGWYTEADGGGTQFTAATPVMADITVYAKWTEDFYQEIDVTGFNEDVIANGDNSTLNGDQLPSVTTSFDAPNNSGARYVFYSKDYTGPFTNAGAGKTAATYGGLPIDGKITSLANTAITYQLQDYSNNNVLLLTSTDNVKTLTLNFSDQSTTSTTFSVPDWYTQNSTIAIKQINRIRYKLTAGSVDNPPANGTPFLYDCEASSTFGIEEASIFV